MTEAEKTRRKIYGQKYAKTLKRKQKMKEYRAKWKLANPEYVRFQNKKAKHKLNYGEVYEEKLKRIERQGGRCANPGCRTTDPGYQGWHTDHNHVTGKVRGELCGACNKALGFVQDDIFKAEGLASYLRQHL